MREVYKTIPAFPRYLISNFGNVKNAITGNSISQRKSANGYMRFNVRRGFKGEKPTTLYTHRVVAELFLEPVEGKTYVNHKDCDKTNNHVDNLEWCTPQENSIHAYENIVGLKEKYIENITKAIKAAKLPIIAYQNGKYIGRFDSKKEAAEYLKIDEKTIYNSLCKGMTNRKGYSFFVAKGVV